MKFKTASKMLREAATDNGHDMKRFSGGWQPGVGTYYNSECKHCGEWLYIETYDDCSGNVVECGGGATESMCKRELSNRDRIRLVGSISRRILHSIMDANISVTADEYVVQYYNGPNMSYRISIPKKEID